MPHRADFNLPGTLIIEVIRKEGKLKEGEGIGEKRIRGGGEEEGGGGGGRGGRRGEMIKKD